MTRSFSRAVVTHSQKCVTGGAGNSDTNTVDWANARPDRNALRAASSSRKGSTDHPGFRQSPDMALPVRLRQPLQRADIRASHRADGELWLPSQGNAAWRQPRDPRATPSRQTPRVSHLASGERSLLSTPLLELRELRWAWHQDVRRLARRFRCISSRHGSGSQGNDIGPHRPERRLLTLELSLGELQRAGVQSPQKTSHSVRWTRNESGRRCANSRTQLRPIALRISPATWLERRGDSRACRWGAH